MRSSFLIVGFSTLIITASGCATSGPWQGPSRIPATRSGAPKPVVSTPVPDTAASAQVVKPAEDEEMEELVRTAASVFGEAESDSEIALSEPEWDIDVRSYETHDRVSYYLDLFSGSARDRFQSRLSLGTRYEPMIRAKMRLNGMPEDLTYLALIESGYDPHAYSRAAAVGMWQFMSSTARAVGLRVDWWVDERRDPAKSTDGAIRFLRDLHQQFGSYYLAAAAYNGGPGRVSRGLTRFAGELEGYEGDDRFFALADQDYLRAETKNYVPQLIAAALVAKSPERFGIIPDQLPLYEYDSVMVAPGTSLAAVAQASGTSSDELRSLNPAILRGVAPPDGSIWVRVPVGTAAMAVAALDTMSQVLGYKSVKVSGAASIATFAKRNDVTTKQLRWFNPGIRTNAKGMLVVGQTLRVPLAGTLAYAQEVPDPAVERYGSSSATSKTTPTSSSTGTHVVKRGETLSGLARRYGMSVAQLKALNGLQGSRIVAGQRLRVRSTAKQVSQKR